MRKVRQFVYVSAVIASVSGASLQDRSLSRTFLDLSEPKFEIVSPDHHDHHDEHTEHPHDVHEEAHEAVHESVGDIADDIHHAEEGMQEHVDHGTKVHHVGVNGDCPGNQSTNSVAVALMTTVVLGPLIALMAHSKACNGEIATITLKMIDLSTSIFLAVLWFTASAEILETKYIHNMFPYSEECFAITQVIFLYTVVMVIVYYLKDKDSSYLIAFCSIAAHYVAFAGIKAAGETQHVVSSLAPEVYEPYVSILYCLIVLFVLGSMSAICFYSWRRHDKEAVEMQEAIEELELDIVGLVLSFAIMQAVRHVLTGHYPAQAHFFLQQPEVQVETPMNVTLEFSLFGGHYSDGGHGRDHTQSQRTFMLLWSVGLTIFACLVLQPMEEIKNRAEDEGNYVKQKAVRVAQVVLVMCVAWGYLLWGEWQFYEVYFRGDKMFGKMVFAMTATFCVLGFIIALAYATTIEGLRRRLSTGRLTRMKGYADLCVMALSLVAAWSWEHCFHTAINVIADQYQVGYGGIVPKLILAFGVPLVIMPGYLFYLKPALEESTEHPQEGEHEKGADDNEATTVAS